MKMIMLPNGRHCIEHNGTRGPSAPYEGACRWPSNEKPELIGFTQYYGGNLEQVFVVQREVPYMDIEFADESVS